MDKDKAKAETTEQDLKAAELEALEQVVGAKAAELRTIYEELKETRAIVRQLLEAVNGYELKKAESLALVAKFLQHTWGEVNRAASAAEGLGLHAQTVEGYLERIAVALELQAIHDARRNVHANEIREELGKIVVRFREKQGGKADKS